MSTSALAFGALLAPTAYGLTGIIGLRGSPSDPRPAARIGRLAGWASMVVAAGAALAVGMNGAVSTPTIGAGGLGLSVRLDALSAVMLAMISLLAFVIYRYSCTYLSGDSRHSVFLGRLAVTVLCVEVLVLAGNLFVLIGAWVATSLALHRLLLFYPDRRAAVVAGHKKFVAARIGDAFLIAAAVALYNRFGTGDLATIFAAAPRAVGGGWAMGSVEVAAVCLAVAAVLKSAQFPTHGWLVEVMETPTPVSALLHAGILNAGPFLVLRMAYVLDGSAAATLLLIAIGGFTAVFASVVLLTQPTVKVGLGYSSVAHMGFMLLVCGLGIYPAVLLHLVAHSFYKAHAFLSSGGVVGEIRTTPVAVPQRLGQPVRLLASGGIALGLYGLFAVAFRLDFDAQPMLVVVGAILVLGTTQLIGPALDSSGPLVAAARASLLAFAVTLSFFSLEATAHVILGDTVPHDGARTAVHVALVAVLLLACAVVVGFQLTAPSRPTSARRARLAVHLRNGLYANAAFDRLVSSLSSSTPASEQTR